MRFVVSRALVLAALAFFSVFAADAHATQPVACGQVSDATGSTLDVVAYAKACGGARRLMQRYFDAVLRGDCAGNGKSCRLTISGYRCTAASAASYEDTGIAATCRKASRRVVAERPK